MMRIARVATMLAVSGGLALIASAQTPDPSGGQLDPNSPAAVASQQEQAALKLRRKSLVHHYPYPYPEYYQSDRTAGFRNPGGMGRYLEYYPPGNQFQVGTDPVRPAQFATGFGNIQEQMAAQQLGVQKENAIMNHIDRMARPSFGVGFFGGFY